MLLDQIDGSLGPDATNRVTVVAPQQYAQVDKLKCTRAHIGGKLAVKFAQHVCSLRHILCLKHELSALNSLGLVLAPVLAKRDRDGTLLLASFCE